MYQRIFKRLLDIVLALTAMPFLLLLVAVFAPVIRLWDHGPVIYSGPRLGRNGRQFSMYKLRTMTVGAPDLRNTDGSAYSGTADPRVTPVGQFLRKTSLDEAPQLINVLKGDMSLVGPRPDLPDGLKIYNGSQWQKLKVRPGLTGYSQAYFRNSVDMSAKFRNDIFYVNHVSFALDLKILFKTAGNVLAGKNIYASEDKQQ
jgi:lipopolysaccharide/colanic/teichoic acid biosynthesis glycosyltransferase